MYVSVCMCLNMRLSKNNKTSVIEKSSERGGGYLRIGGVGIRGLLERQTADGVNVSVAVLVEIDSVQRFRV